ncbi:hypothetical protein PCK2_000262 [Pneumocystis canis]|nr:hypothetical protein PCK2_000262 [Pneumocystis canis]
MEIYASRLASFQISSRKKQKWPHLRPTPKDLADAGFYYDPSPLSYDNVVCFLCKKALDGWDVDDNPVKEHIQHSRQCGWAILKYIKLGDTDMNAFTEKELQEARKATFGSWWPHEQKRGRFLKIIKMSQAGFYYNPTPDSNDMVSCIHCGLGIGFEESQNDFIPIKTVPSRNYKKNDSLKNSKSGRKFSLKTSTRSSYDNIQKKMGLKSRNLKIERKDELLSDEMVSIGVLDIEQKSEQALKTNNINNLKKKLKNTFELSSKLSEDIPLQLINKGNNCEKSSDFSKQVKIFDDSVIKNGFEDSLQHKSKRMLDFSTSKNQVENSKDISELGIFNDDDKKISDWVPINIQTFVLNSSNNKLINPYEFTAAELDMTIEEWIKFITQKQVEKLEIECKRMISVLKKEGERARQAILSIDEL